MNNHRALPFRAIGADAVIAAAGRRRLVVIAPHPDDETLGCGSLIARAIARGVAVGVIALTDGDASHPGSTRWPAPALARLRAGEMRRALARLGAGGVAIRRLGWGDGSVEREGRVTRLRHALAGLGAGVVLVTSDADHHPDHKAAMALARAATRGLGVPLVRYAVWSRVDTGNPRANRHRAAKRWAVAAHRSQLGTYIDDDPDGFSFDAAALASLVRHPEAFAEASLG